MDLLSYKNFLVLSLAAFVLIFLAFFPTTFASIDEHTFLKNSILLKNGSIAETNPELACRSHLYTENGYVGSQFIGRSVFLIPFTLFGLNGAMLSGLAIHILNALLVYLILKKLSIDARFTILYIFFPVMLWEARTLYSELFVLTAFLAAFYFYINNKKESDVISGILLGLAVFVRYDAAAAFIAFALPLLIFDRKKLLGLLTGFVPLILLLFAFNNYAYSGPLNAGYGSGTSLLSSLFLIEPITVLAYLLVFLVLLPGMLISPIFSKNKQYLFQFVLLALAYLFLASRFTSFTAYEFSIENLFTSRLRYVVPLIGIFLISYSGMLDNFLSKIKIDRKMFFAGAFILLVVGGAYASYSHSKFLNSRAETRDQIQQNIPEGSLIIGSSDDCMFSLTPELERRSYLNIMQGLDIPREPEINFWQRLNGAYIIQLSYSKKEGARQQVIDAERKAMEEFVKQNSVQLQLIFETASPNSLKIYKWIG